MYTFNPSSWEANSLWVWGQTVLQRVQGQPGLCYIKKPYFEKQTNKKVLLLSMCDCGCSCTTTCRTQRSQDSFCKRSSPLLWILGLYLRLSGFQDLCLTPWHPVATAPCFFWDRISPWTWNLKFWLVSKPSGPTCTCFSPMVTDTYHHAHWRTKLGSSCLWFMNSAISQPLLYLLLWKAELHFFISKNCQLTFLNCAV